MLDKTSQSSSAARTKQTGSEEIETKPKKARSFQGYSINWMKLSKSNSFINNVIDYFKSCYDPVYKEKIQNEFFEYMKKEVESGGVQFLGKVPKDDLSATQREKLESLLDLRSATSNAMENMTTPGLGPDSIVVGDYSIIHNEFHQGKINTQQYLEKLVNEILKELDGYKDEKFAEKSFNNLEKEISRFLKEEGTNAMSQTQKEDLMNLVAERKEQKLMKFPVRKEFVSIAENQQLGVEDRKQAYRDAINEMIGKCFNSATMLAEVEKDVAKFLKQEDANIFSSEEKTNLLTSLTILKLQAELILSIRTEFQNRPLTLFPKLNLQISEITLKYENKVTNSMDELAKLKMDYMKQLVTKTKETLGTDENATIWLKQTAEKILNAPKPGFTEAQKQEIMGIINIIK